MPVQKISHTFSDEVLFEVEEGSLKSALEKATAMEMDLEYANLKYANLKGANLKYANLRGANLKGANLKYANLKGANLKYANLKGANLKYANLEYANLRGANLDSEEIKRWANCPLSGEFIAWKKGSNGEIIKLQIPAFARRVSPITDRKCRAEFAIVLGIEDKRGKQISECTGRYDGKLKYQVGKFVTPDSYDASPLIECSHGIHFFLTQQEAIDW